MYFLKPYSDYHYANFEMQKIPLEEYFAESSARHSFLYSQYYSGKKKDTFLLTVVTIYARYHLKCVYNCTLITFSLVLFSLILALSGLVITIARQIKIVSSLTKNLKT